MKVIIEWCNTNSGFLTGILSLLTLVVSVIAVFVSIRTARMPYRKCIKVRPGLNFLFEKNLLNGKVDSQFDALVVNVNILAR